MKKLFVVLLTAVCALTLVACGNNKPQEEVKDPNVHEILYIEVQDEKATVEDAEGGLVGELEVRGEDIVASFKLDDILDVKIIGVLTDKLEEDGSTRVLIKKLHIVSEDDVVDEDIPEEMQEQYSEVIKCTYREADDTLVYTLNALGEEFSLGYKK